MYYALVIEMAVGFNVVCKSIHALRLFERN
jgi:hypothetical protein